LKLVDAVFKDELETVATQWGIPLAEISDWASEFITL
jgi:hypothetical protein